DNLRAALQWAQESGEVAVGLRLAGALEGFWHIYGHLSEGRAWLEGLLARGEVDERPATVAVRAKALDVAGGLTRQLGDLEHAMALQQDSLTLYRVLGDRQGVAAALMALGQLARDRGDLGRATALVEESVGLYRELGDKIGIAWGIDRLGLIAQAQGDYGRAVLLYEESLALDRA